MVDIITVCDASLLVVQMAGHVQYLRHPLLSYSI